MEMMMMQNHQMHQLVVQQMMLHSLPGGRMTQAPVTYMSEPTVVRSPVPPAVHHHHYQMSPPPQPAVHHYSALPPIEPKGQSLPQPGRIVSPVRGELQGYQPIYYQWFQQNTLPLPLFLATIITMMMGPIIMCTTENGELWTLTWWDLNCKGWNIIQSCDICDTTRVVTLKFGF